MNTKPDRLTERPLSRVLLSALAVATIGLSAIQGAPAIAQANQPGAMGNQVAPAPLKPLVVGIKRTDTHTTVAVGTELKFAVTVHNPNTAAEYGGTYTIFPTASTISGVAYESEARGNCRWKNLTGPRTLTCESNGRTLNLFHRVTQADIDRGYFDASATFDLSSDTRGVNKLAPSATGQLRINLPKVTDPAAPPAPPAPAGSIKVVWERTDQLGEQVYVGDKLTWNVRITNATGQDGVAFPRSANVDSALVPGQQTCRYGNFSKGFSYPCPVSYTVKESDLKKGAFTPEIQMDFTRDRAGEQVVIKGEPVQGAPVVIVPGTRPRNPDDPFVLANPGDHGFTCHRIPALTTAPNGWLLAAWDGRPDNCRDAPNPNSIIQWISKDGGKTWDAADRRVVAAGQLGAEKYGYSDPSYVVDRVHNKIFMFFVKSFDKSFQDSQKGTEERNRNVLHAAVMESGDNGLTWTEPKVITAAIQPDGDSTGQQWFSRFAASGEGIQLRYGAHKGRLIQQFTFKSANGYYAASVFSDDHGVSWKAGKPIGPAMDENKVVELSNGDVLLNSRRSDQGKNRIVARSTDGGMTWADRKDETRLIDPRNNASIHRAFPEAPMNSACAKVLLFSNAASTTSRQNGMISVSLDDGQNWTQALQFKPGAMAYSTLTALADANGRLDSGKYGILYEAEQNAITYKTFGFDQLNIDPAKKKELLDTCVAKAPTPPPVPQPPVPQPPTPQPPTPQQPPAPAPQPTPDTKIEGVGSVTRVAGESRVETAVSIAKTDFKDGAPVVLLARSDVFVDAAAAVPLAKHHNAPVLLSQPDTIHPKVLDTLKELKTQEVMILGGKAAISAEAEAELVKAGLKVTRVAGENRAATAVAIATTLDKAGKAKQVLVTDGTDWQPTMIAGPVAAKLDGVTLLTNGTTPAPETTAYLATLSERPVAIGTVAKETLKLTDAVTADDPSALSLAVAQRFFTQEASTVGIATTADFADALTGGAHVGRRNGPLLLSGPKVPNALVTWVSGATKTREVVVFGGESRFAQPELDRLAGK